jgi:hypothetical protein
LKIRRLVLFLGALAVVLFSLLGALAGALFSPPKTKEGLIEDRIGVLFFVQDRIFGEKMIIHFMCICRKHSKASACRSLFHRHNTDKKGQTRSKRLWAPVLQGFHRALILFHTERMKHFLLLLVALAVGCCVLGEEVSV